MKVATYRRIFMKKLKLIDYLKLNYFFNFINFFLLYTNFFHDLFHS